MQKRQRESGIFQQFRKLLDIPEVKNNAGVLELLEEEAEEKTESKAIVEEFLSYFKHESVGMGLTINQEVP